MHQQQLEQSPYSQQDSTSLLAIQHLRHVKEPLWIQRYRKFYIQTISFLKPSSREGPSELQRRSPPSEVPQFAQKLNKNPVLYTQETFSRQTNQCIYPLTEDIYKKTLIMSAIYKCFSSNKGLHKFVTESQFPDKEIKLQMLQIY